MADYYDIDGNKLTMLEWAQGFESRRADPDGPWNIGRDTVANVTVSTVWLGLDHNFFGGPPLIFETMTFGEGEWNNACWRYSTKEQAAAGHARVLEVLRKGLTVDDVETGGEP